MKVKAKSAILSVVLCLFGMFSLFSLSACGNVSLQTLSDNFEELDQIYSDNADVFQAGFCGDFYTEYLINYGEKVDELVFDDTPGYAELRDRYNIMLAVSNDYIDGNRQYILSWSEDSLTSDARAAINTLNASLVDYKDYISTFLRERNNLIGYFDKFQDSMNEESHMSRLRNFKRYYANLVQKNIQLSLDMAEAVKTTEIFDLLRETEPTEVSTRVIKDYMVAKILPVFSEFMLTEVENKLNWSAFSGGAKEQIDTLLSSLEQKFDFYKAQLISIDNQIKVFESKEAMQNFYDLTESFFVEMDDYLQALKDLDIYTLITSYNNSFEEYLAENSLANVYFEKMEQFINISLENFLTNAANQIYVG